ncbi:MAG: CotH kinase family protein [Myxococcales bacterium]|nr:CotH kinase family protein [Myxococcales bacterium]
MLPPSRPLLASAASVRAGPLAARMVTLSVAITVLATAAPAQILAARINCGGPSVPAPDGGVPFAADGSYIPGVRDGFVGGHVLTHGSPNQIGPLGDPFHAVQSSAREAASAYRFTLPNGAYLVRLHMAEISPDVHGPNLRRFDVRVEGDVLLADVDPGALFGSRYGGTLVARANVVDQVLDVEFEASLGSSLVSGIEVFALPPGVPEPAVPDGLVAKPGHRRTILTWTPDPSPTLFGYRVERAPSPSGPWELAATLPPQPARFHDEGAPAGVPMHYRLSALDVGLVPGTPSTSVSGAALPEDASELLVLRLTVDPADLAFLDANVLDPVLGDEEVPATAEIAGETYPVQVRYRGAGSRGAPKKGWKVKFPKAQPFEGRDELNLKANFVDDSMVKERSLRALFTTVEHPVARERWVRLELNGVDRGVFNEVEQLDELYLAARGRDPSGSLFKCRDGLGLLGSPEEYAAEYDLQTASAELSEIVAFIEFLNGPSTSLVDLADAFDLDGYLDYLAVVTLVGDTDQLVRNFHLLHDHGLERWEWITWDNDRIMFDPQFPVDWGTSGCACGPVNQMLDRVLSEDALRWRFVQKLVGLLTGAGSPAAFGTVIDDEHAAVLLDALADCEKAGWEIDDPFLAGPDDLAAFLDARLLFLLAEAQAFAPALPPSRVWINEFAARGVDGVLDEAGDADDWIELVSTGGGAPLDLGGYTLTDDLGVRAKWTLPPGTLLPAGQHLLIWCDDEPSEGPLHATFKLSGDGEEIGLFSPGGTLLDVVHFGPQRADLVRGRSVDAGPFFATLATPTPGAPNTTLGNVPPWVTLVDHAPALPGSGQPVEVAATVFDTDGIAFASLSYRVDGGPLVSLPMAPAGPDRWTITLSPQPAGTLVECFVTATDALGASGSFPEDAPASWHAWVVTDPQPGDIRLTEFMADNAATLADETGAFEDWLELANVGSAPVDLTGWTLTDDLALPAQWTLPAGTTLRPGERALVWADDDAGDGPLHASFKLGKSGEEIALFDARGTLVDVVVFGPQQTDVSQGRLPDAEATGQPAPLWFLLLDPSPGAANLPAPGGALRYASPSGAATLQLQRVSGGGVPGALVLSAEGGTAGAGALLVLGLLPLDVPAPPYGTLLLLPIAELSQLFALDAGGHGEVAFGVPGNPNLVALPLFLQAYTVDQGLSNGVLVTLGG